MRLSTLLAAPALLLASTAFAGGLGEMTDIERDAFREEIRAYLLENPEVLVEAMSVLQEREAQTAAARRRRRATSTRKTAGRTARR